MPVITGVIPSRGGERAAVYADGELVAWLSGETAARLVVGAELADGEVEGLRQDGARDEARRRALRFLRTRCRSRAEVERRLARYGYDRALIAGVVAALTVEGWLDDDAFAAAYVRDRCALRPRGKKVIAAELRRLGVADEVALAALAANYGPDEEELARRALGNRGASMMRRGSLPGKKAVCAFLARRGFSYGLARRLADEVAAAALGPP